MVTDKRELTLRAQRGGMAWDMKGLLLGKAVDVISELKNIIVST